MKSNESYLLCIVYTSSMDSLGVVKEAVKYFKVTNSVRKQTKEKAESYSGKKVLLIDDLIF